jgi:hypothetical protein
MSGSPLLLPEDVDLLRVVDQYGAGQAVDLPLEHLQLTVWRLSGSVVERTLFREIF